MKPAPAALRGAVPGRTPAAPCTGLAAACRLVDDLYKIGYDSVQLPVAKIAVTEARERLSEVVELAQEEAVFLERYGQLAAVLVSPARYEQLMEALEESEDIAAFDAAMSEEGDNIPWDQVKADLGWV